MANRVFAWMLLFLVVFMPGCAERGPINIDFKGTDSELLAAEHAADDWNKTCGKTLVRVHKSTGDGVPTSGQLGLLEGRHLGTTHCVCGEAQWIIYQSDSKFSLSQILAHEFGHAILSCSDKDHDFQQLMTANLNPKLVDKNGDLMPGAITQDMCDAALQ